MHPSLAVIATDIGLVPRAEALASSLCLPCLGLHSSAAELSPELWLIIVGASGLAVQRGGARAAGPVSVDLVGGKMGFRRRRQGATPDLVKAVGQRSGVYPEVWDLTAGLGQDAFVLALHGHPVRLFERNPLVHCLLADGLARARQAAEAGERDLQAVIDRLQLTEADSLTVLSQMSADFHAPVIYIDTMFPERSKSAKVKKGMQLFQQLVGEDADADQLFALALERAYYRVVVKRPRHAPALQGRAAPLQFGGKSIRFDVYPLRKIEASRQ